MAKTADSVDVIVVGSGAGGDVSACALTQAGLKVLMLEAGRHYDPGESSPATVALMRRDALWAAGESAFSITSRALPTSTRHQGA